MKNQFFWPQAERPTDRPLHGFFFGIVVRLTTFLFPPTVCFFATVTKDDGITQLNDFSPMSMIKKFKVYCLAFMLICSKVFPNDF